jgi:hypothetical protein
MEMMEVNLSDRDRMIFEDIAHTLRAIEKNMPRQLTLNDSGYSRLPLSDERCSLMFGGQSDRT